MLSSAKVLLVDDEETFVETLAERLELRGFATQTATTGDAALDILQKHAVDVVVLDVVMPGKDGIETLKIIKSINPLVEVIMLTGHATVETAIQGMRLGAYDYLMKPTDTEELILKINKARDRKVEHEERIQQAHIDNLVKTRGW